MAIEFGTVRHKRLAIFLCINARVSMGKKQKLMQIFYLTEGGTMKKLDKVKIIIAEIIAIIVLLIVKVLVF